MATVHSSPPHGQSATSLLQPPRKWTVQHVKLANVHVHDNALPSQIAPSQYIPDDDNSGFQKLAQQLCDPSREELEGLAPPKQSANRDENIFGLAFEEVTLYLKNFKPSRLHLYLYTGVLSRIIIEIVEYTPINGDLLYLSDRVIPIKVPQLLSGNKPLSHDAIAKPVRPGVLSIPLMLLSVVKLPSSTELQLARNEVPQCLLQAILAYSQNPNLKEYTTFAISLCRTNVYVVRASISQEYMRGFFQNRQIVEQMQLYRSEPFDLLSQEGRKGFLRLMMGVLPFLADKEDSNIEIAR